MARPESIKDIPLEERNEQIGSFNVGKLSTSPTLLKHYATFVEQIEKAGGHIVPNKWNSSEVDIFIPKTSHLLDYRLSDMQQSWDHSKKMYDKAVLRDGIGDMSEWDRDRIVKFAEAEQLPNPFDPFCANDDELDEIRRELEASR
jgi:hypothetical protein